MEDMLKKNTDERISHVSNVLYNTLVSPGYTDIVSNVSLVKTKEGMDVRFKAVSDGRQNVSGLLLRGGAFAKRDGSYRMVKPITMDAFN
jgi:hypothetical protein